MICRKKFLKEGTFLYRIDNWMLVERKIEDVREIFFSPTRSASCATTWKKIDISGCAKRKFGTRFILPSRFDLHAQELLRIASPEIIFIRSIRTFYIRNFNLFNEQQCPRTAMHFRPLLSLADFIAYVYKWVEIGKKILLCFMQNTFLSDEN